MTDSPRLSGRIVCKIPELVDGLKRRLSTSDSADSWLPIKGLQAVWRSKWDALRGGFIGAFIGLLLTRRSNGRLDGIWTVAAHTNEEFGKGNIKGVIGP